MIFYSFIRHSYLKNILKVVRISSLDRVIVKSICNAYIYLFINVVLIFTVEKSMQ
jgi:hypothetical protein